MNDSLNNQNNNSQNNDDFNFRKEFENQKKELASMQRMTQSYHTVTDLPADGGNSYKRGGFHIKFRHILFFCILAVVGLYFYNYYTVNKEDLYEGNANIKSLYDKNNLIKYFSNGLYGYINYNGEIVINAKYVKASDFYNGYAIVSGDNNQEIINVNGEHMLDVSNNSKGYNINYDYWYLNGTLYSGKLLKLRDEVNLVEGSEKYFYYYNFDLKKTILMDYTGKTIYEFDVKDINFIVKTGSYTNDLIYVEHSGKYMIINPDSLNVIYDSNEKITLLDDGIYKKDRFYYIYDDETYYPFDAKNVVLVDKFKKILKVEVSDTEVYYHDLVNNSKIDNYVEDSVGIVDSQFNYDIVLCDKENNRYSLMKDGNTLLECKYDEISFLNDNLHEYIKSKNGQEFVFAKNVELEIIFNTRVKLNSLEEDYVNKSYVDGSPFVFYTPMEDNDENYVVVYNLSDSSRRKYPKNDYSYFDSGYNYYVLYNIRNEKLEYYNYNMKNIFSIDYDRRLNEEIESE